MRNFNSLQHIQITKGQFSECTMVILSKNNWFNRS